jgi:SsrA-binding protein
MAKKKSEDQPPVEKVICRNRKAKHEYDIIDSVEAGIVLTGTEVKSLRQGQASLEEAYARVENNELWIHKLEIPEYAMGNIMNHVTKRQRKLLLHRREINKFATGAAQRGFTLIPLQVYFKNGRAKVEIALAKGKKLHDKRQSIKDRETKADMRRSMGLRRKGR